MWQLLEISIVFNTLILTQIFWKMKTFLKKREYLFLVESTKIEKAIFPYKMELSQSTEFCQ